MRCQVLDFFQLILGVTPKLILDIVNQGLETTKVLYEEDFEVGLYNRNVVFVVAFVLSLSESNSTVEV